MNSKNIQAVLFIWMAFIPSVFAQSPVNLTLDYQKEPLGIDNPTPGFSWVSGNQKRGAVQSAYRILVSSSEENIQQGIGDIWDTRKVQSDEQIQIIYQGEPLKSSTRYFWAVQIWDAENTTSGMSRPSWFETGLLKSSDWKGIWITDHKSQPENDEAFYEKIPAPLFRREFQTAAEVVSARLYISGLGYYEAWINGQRVGDHYLDPGWTQYGKTVYYAAYDVTEYISRGKNAIGVMVGNGWYNPLPMKLFGRWNLREILTIGKPKVIVQLEIGFADGSTEIIYTDEQWKTIDGPVVKNNVYLGEWYDAREEKPGWQTFGYNDDQWEPAMQTTAPAGKLKWQFVPPIRHTRTVHPVKILQPEPGVYVYDMGQNFAGVVRFTGNAPGGTEAVFRYAELVYDDGSIDVRTTAATQIKEGGIQGGPGAPATAWQEDRYIFKGKGKEVFEPRFTFHGFRYVEVSGLPYKPTLNELEGIRLNSDISDNASFKCSNPLFNKVQEVTEWTMLSNVFSIESDCPAREKFGYGGDMVTVGEAYIYNYDMANFYTKTVRDFARDARADGGMTECAPDIGINIRGVTENTGPVGWTLAHPFLVKQLYKYYGNKELVKEQYQPLKDLVDFYHRNVPEHIITLGISDHNVLEDRPVPVTSTAFYYHHVAILAEMAGILGKNEDEAFYNKLAADIKQAFINEFVNPETGEVYTHTQTAQVFALYYDLLPEAAKKKALEVLKNEIYLKHNGHLSTGIFATKMMLNYLSDQGLDEVNYTMMNQKEYPGFGYMIDNDATTLWENWAFKTGDSKNHPMFGSISEWFYKSLLGINQTEKSVAFSEIIIKPSPVAGLQWAEGHYLSVRGKIASKWWKFGDDIFMDVEIPANTTAYIYLPTYAKAEPDIYEQDTLLTSNGVAQTMPAAFTFIRKTNDYVVLKAGGGKYHFKIIH